MCTAPSSCRREYGSAKKGRRLSQAAASGDPTIECSLSSDMSVACGLTAVGPHNSYYLATPAASPRQATPEPRRAPVARSRVPAKSPLELARATAPPRGPRAGVFVAAIPRRRGPLGAWRQPATSGSCSLRSSRPVNRGTRAPIPLATDARSARLCLQSNRTEEPTNQPRTRKRVRPSSGR
jgi:hypothetical protein